MKKLVTAILSIMVIGLFAVFILPVNAEAKVWECYIDPTYERDWWGQYNIAAYVLEKRLGRQWADIMKNYFLMKIKILLLN